MSEERALMNTRRGNLEYRQHLQHLDRYPFLGLLFRLSLHTWSFREQINKQVGSPQRLAERWRSPEPLNVIPKFLTGRSFQWVRCALVKDNKQVKEKWIKSFGACLTSSATGSIQVVGMWEETGKPRGNPHLKRTRKVHKKQIQESDVMVETPFIHDDTSRALPVHITPSITD